MTGIPPTVSNHLPREARDALIAAAATVDPLAPQSLRTRQLEAAIERVKLAYPEYFQQEKQT